jgi:hypothetical protein
MMGAVWQTVRAHAVRANAGITPMDLRVCLALICLPLAYKLLSFDFTAMGTLCARPPIGSFAPEFLYRALVDNRCWLFGGDATRYLQVTGAVALIATVI